MTPRSRAAAGALLLFAAYAYGAASYRHRWPPTPQIERVARQTLWKLRPARGFRDTTGRTRVACADLVDGRTAVWLTLGQSNAANEGDLAYETGAGVYNLNFLDGQCYVAQDPLLGATGTGGSVWTRTADRLIAAGAVDRVVIIAIAVGGSSIRRWAPGGDLAGRIGQASAAVAAAGLRVTAVLWHQGESDVGMDPAEYADWFGKVLAEIRAQGIGAPMYVAQASLCKNHGSPKLRATQRALAARYPGVRAGPDTDTLDRFEWRRDLCHFTAAGLAEHARLWADVLEQAHLGGNPRTAR